jgi:hypothetical protein
MQGPYARPGPPLGLVMPHQEHRLFDPDCIVCNSEMRAGLPRHDRFMWQGATVAVLQTAYNMVRSGQNGPALLILETYLRHLGEWT